MQEILMVIIGIIIGLSLLLILIINLKINNKVIKLSFLLFSILFSIILLIFDNTYILELFKFLIQNIWYPNYLVLVSIVLISIIVLIYTLLSKKISIKGKIKNYTLISINYSLYIIFNTMNIDINSYTSLYSTKSLLILRISTITFIIWIIVTIIFKFLDKLKRSRV